MKHKIISFLVLFALLTSSYLDSSGSLFKAEKLSPFHSNQTLKELAQEPTSWYNNVKKVVTTSLFLACSLLGCITPNAKDDLKTHFVSPESESALHLIKKMVLTENNSLIIQLNDSPLLPETLTFHIRYSYCVTKPKQQGGGKQWRNIKKDFNVQKNLISKNGEICLEEILKDFQRNRLNGTISVRLEGTNTTFKVPVSLKPSSAPLFKRFHKSHQRVFFMNPVDVIPASPSFTGLNSLGLFEKAL